MQLLSGMETVRAFLLPTDTANTGNGKTNAHTPQEVTRQTTKICGGFNGLSGENQGIRPTEIIWKSVGSCPDQYVENMPAVKSSSVMKLCVHHCSQEDMPQSVNANVVEVILGKVQFEPATEGFDSPFKLVPA